MIGLLETYGIPVRLYDAQMSADSQANLIMSALNDGAVGMIVCPLDEPRIASALAEINARHVALVLLTPLQGNYHAANLNQNQYSMGYLVGEMAGYYIQRTLMGNANVILVTMESLPGIREREAGMRAGLSAYLNARIVQTISYQPNDSIRAEFATQVLDAGITFDVVLTFHDTIAFGVVETLTEAGIAPGAVSIFSIGGETPAQSYVISGRYLRGTVISDRIAASHAAVNLMVRLLHNVPVPEYVYIPVLDVLTGQTIR